MNATYLPIHTITFCHDHHYLGWCLAYDRAWIKKLGCLSFNPGSAIELVCLGCYNKISHTGWLIYNRNLFLTVLEAGKSKIKVPAWLSSGESPLPGSSLESSHVSSYGGKG